MDARPHITFSCPVHDDTPLGIAWGKPKYSEDLYPDYERIGDPGKDDNLAYARYSLQEIILYEWNGSTWQTVARPSGAGTQKLYGSWAPVPQLASDGPSSQPTANVENTKLWLWSKNPFDYTRRTLRTWDEWLIENFDHYPCPQAPNPEDFDVSYDFMCIEPGTEVETPTWSHPLNPDLALFLQGSQQIPSSPHRFDIVDEIDGMNMAYCPNLFNDGLYHCILWWGINSELWSNRGIALLIHCSEELLIRVYWRDNLNSGGEYRTQASNGIARVEINKVHNIFHVIISSSGHFCLYKITFQRS